MSDHAYLIASARAIADRHDCSHPGHMLDMAAAIEALVRERDEARTKVARLTQRLQTRYVAPLETSHDVIDQRNAMVKTAEAKVERLRGLLGDARIYVQRAGFRTSSALLARIDAELAEDKP